MRLLSTVLSLGVALPQAWAAQSSSASSGIVPSAFTVPGPFPTTAYSKYYNSPTATSAQVQPVISDPVTVRLHDPLLLEIVAQSSSMITA
jgi:sphingomyelin phosphodiesterase